MIRKLTTITILLTGILILVSCEKEVSKSIPITPKPTGGTLKISSIPSGANIYLDDKTTGLVTPDSITWLEVKNYKVTLKKEFYLDSTFQVNVEESKTKEYRIDFNSSPNMWGSITCQTTPDNAKIFLNGKFTGKRTSTTIDSLIPGNYIIKYISENTRADSAMATVTSGKNTLSLLVLTDTTYWVDYNSNTSEIPNDTYNKIAIDNNDNIWLGSVQNGLTKFDGKTWVKYTRENSGLIGNNIIELIIGPNKHLWVCTFSGLSEYDGTMWKNYSINDGTGLPSNQINDVTFDVDGMPVVATNKGLARLENNNQWKVYTFDLIFPDSYTDNDKKDQNYFTGIDINKNGDWWATRLRNGITYKNGTTIRHYFTYYDNFEELDPNIYYSTVRHSDNEIWFGHTISSINHALVGLSSYINRNFDKSTYTIFYNVNINSIRIRNGNEKWISTSSGLFYFTSYDNIQSYKKNTTPLTTNDIQDVAFDSKGNVWVVTAFNGLYKYKVGKR